MEEEKKNQENSADISDYSDDPKSRTSASSRVNFSKLTAEEKERRCYNMSKEVKALKRKIKQLENKPRKSARATREEPMRMSDSLIQRATEKLQSYPGFDLAD